MKVTVAGKGGVGKTTLASELARLFAAGGQRTLAVDCDPNPNLAESFGLTSAGLPRFTRDGLARASGTLELARMPSLVQVGDSLWLLGGPPSENPLADAVARGIAGVLVADRFDATVTDLGAGPELARVAVGGVLNPADVCLVLTDATRAADLAADRIEAACRDRQVRWIRVTVGREAAAREAVAVYERLTAM